MVAGPTTPPTSSNPNTPANNQPGPVNLPDQLTGPVVGSNADPQDDWLSPGNSPGILEVYENFTLRDGDTLLFEILGPNPGVGGYDQLIVNGDVELLGGNIVIAFINGYPKEASDLLFDLIVAKSITYGENPGDVNFYYGFFDDPYLMHAPYDLNYYTLWTDDITKLSKEIADLDEQEALRIGYYGRPPVIASVQSVQDEPKPQPFEPVLTIGAEIPTPAPLLLLATGLLLAGSFRRRV